jgi:hypothetical protein
MAADPRPHLLGALHQLWPDRRLLRSPLTAVLLFTALVAVLIPIRPALPGRYWIGRVPEVMALAAAAMAWQRATDSGLVRDWRLAGRDPVTLARWIFLPPLVLWWVSLSLINDVFILRRLAEISSLDEAPASSLLLVLPSTQGISGYARPADADWLIWNFEALLILVPLTLLLWAFVMRWLTEALLTALRRPLTAFLVAAAALLGLRAAAWWGLSLFQVKVSLAIQLWWPSQWSLPARLLAGLFIVWLTLPLVLTVVGLGARRWALRARDRWWSEAV